MKKYLEQYYNDNEYPALIAQIEQWSKSRPFAGLKILDATPVFRNTMTKYLALLAGGAELTVGISDDIPHDKAIVELLPTYGVSVINSQDCQAEFDIILDCAGSFSTLNSQLGYVELTKSGLYRYENCLKPVFLADEGRIKEIETVLGTGDGFFRAMNQLGYTEFTNKKVVVFGYGKVGRGVAMYLSQAGAVVHVVDDHSMVKIADGMIAVNRYSSSEVESAVSGAYCVVSVTGIKGAWQGVFDPTELLASDSIIVNMGVEDEFGDEIPASRVLNNKKPLNFLLDEPTLLRYIEATMALHNFGAVLLATKKCSAGLNKPTKEQEEMILKTSASQGLIGTEINMLGL